MEEVKGFFSSLVAHEVEITGKLPVRLRFADKECNISGTFLEFGK